MPRRSRIRVTQCTALLCVVGMVPGMGCSRQIEPETAKPLLKVSQPHVDVGIFRHGVDGQYLEQVYSITVTADAPVRVESIESSCGCLAAISDIVGEELPPKSKHLVKLQMRTSDRAGMRSEFARVVTKPPSPAPIVMTLRATVVAPPTITPSPLLVDVALDTRRIQAKVVANCLRESESRALELDRVGSSFDPFEVVDAQLFTMPSGQPGREMHSLKRDELRLSLALERALPIGNHEFSLRLVWKGANVATTLPVEVRVLHPVQLSLNRLFFGELVPGERCSVQVPIVRTAADAPRPDSIMCDLDFVEAVFDEAAQQLTVSVSAPTSPGRLEGTLTLSFGVDATPPIPLPVGGVVAEQTPPR